MNIIHWTNYRSDSPSKIARQSSETVVPLRKRIYKTKKNQQQSFKQLYKEQAFNTLVKRAQEINEYDEIKIQGQILKLNDYVQIKNSGVEDFIGTLVRIISITEPETQKLVCLCQVKWFMKRNEILPFIPRARKWISESEVFSTQSLDYILAQTIVQKCTIVSCDEFSDSNTYFNRLEWDVEQKKFTNMNTIQLYCLCQQPWNPELKYIQCDKCQKWYHFNCVNIQEDYSEEQYICGYCN